MLSGVCAEAKRGLATCGDCSQGQCYLDECIPCSPTCENLTEDGNIMIKKCHESGCDTLDIVLGFDEHNRLNLEETIDMYGEIMKYPYSI